VNSAPKQLCDIVIAGGGLAGLAMAMELTQAPFAALKVMVIEPRTHYERDRTWSFWACAPHAYEHLERQAWARWRVACAGDEAFFQLPTFSVPNGTKNGGNPNKAARYTYRSIDADAFYTEALRKIAACPHIELRLGLKVNEIRGAKSSARCELELGNGEILHTQLVLDARAGLAHPPLDAHHLAQHFCGWEIETDQDVFDASTLDLMDFMPAEDGLHFFYVLPYSPRRALIEATWVSPAHLHQDHADRLVRYIAKRWPGLRYQKRFEEKASLPLLAQLAPSSHGRVIKIGRAAGTLRAATGYAFLETVADCQRLAAQIAASCEGAKIKPASLKPFQRKAADRFMDALFLRVLANDWAGAPALFLALFRHVPSDRLIRFLSSQATWIDRAHVVFSLPKWRFLRCLFRFSEQPNEQGGACSSGTPPR
jgi:lycopene beta-cyclase